MPLGLALITIKNVLMKDSAKGVLDSSFPKEFNMSRGLIQKITKIVLNSSSKGGEVLELKYSDKIILVHLKELEDPQTLELFIIILSSDETSKVKEFYDLLANHIKLFYNQNKRDRTLNFEKFAKIFFKEDLSKKLLFIGFPSAGKTCIKKAFFDGEDPQVLLGNSAPEPTRGLAHFVYSWLDAEVGIVDSSGQEFELYVSPNNSFERTIAFEESDIIIYVFDVVNWEKESEKVIENLEKVITTKNSTSATAKIYAFCHKIDLLSGSNKEKAKQFLKIKEILENRFNIKTIFTSIQPELIHTLFRSIQIILNELSNLGNSIEDFCQEVIKDQKKSTLFLLNDDNLVISQKSSSDMNLDDVSQIIELVKNQRTVLKNTPDLGGIDYSIIHTKKEMVLIVKAVNILKYGVSTIAFLSQNVTNKTINQIVEKLDKRIAFEKRIAGNTEE